MCAWGGGADLAVFLRFAHFPFRPMSGDVAVAAAAAETATAAGVAVEAPAQQQPPPESEGVSPPPPPPSSSVVVDQAANGGAGQDASPRVDGGDGGEEEKVEDLPFELKNMIANRAAFKRLKDEIEGDIVRIDRDIAAYKKARSSSSTAETETAAKNVATN